MCVCVCGYLFLKKYELKILDIISAVDTQAAVLSIDAWSSAAVAAMFTIFIIFCCWLYFKKQHSAVFIQ